MRPLGLATIPPLGTWVGEMIPYPHRVVKTETMTHTSREKLDLVNRTKKFIGQLESALRGLNEDEQCADGRTPRGSHSPSHAAQFQILRRRRRRRDRNRPHLSQVSCRDFETSVASRSGTLDLGPISIVS